MVLSSRAYSCLALTGVFCLALSSCSSSSETASSKPKPGTPAFFWLSANEAIKQGDYVRAQSLLADLGTGKSEYAAKARPLAAVLSHGVSHAYIDLSEKYAAGAKKARANQAVLYRLTGEYKAKAKAAGMRYVEIARVLTAELKPDQNVVIAFQLPEGPAADPGQYQKISAGTAIPAAENESVETHVVRHDVMLATLAALGVESDVEKGRSMYTVEGAQVPAQQFLLELAEGLYETADMFGPKRLNQPNDLRSVLLQEAGKALAMVKESKETKELDKKIKAATKNLTNS